MSEFSTRTCDQEPDTITIIPGFPDYVVIGTYSLSASSSSEIEKVKEDAGGGSRKGSLQIMPYSSDMKGPQEPSSGVSLARKDFSFGIYDIHFHSEFQDLLGVAASDAEILLFRTLPQYDSSGALETIRLVEAGRILVEEPHPDDERLAIITQFRFLTPPNPNITASSTGQSTILLAATTQFGNTKIIRTTLPGSEAKNTASQDIDYQMVDVHKQSFDLEAWTVLPIFASPSTLYLLSGGDDSQLLISSIESSPEESLTNDDIDLDLITLSKLFTDKRTHEAGVVYICTLGLWPSGPVSSHPNLAQPDEHNQYLILTGSYDEHLRLFLFSPPTPSQPRTQLKLLTDIHLVGGVWRIIHLDDYETATSREYILLIAAHTAGAYIVRLSCSKHEDGGREYTFKIEKWFKEGHESLVYAVVAKRADDAERSWDVISASFYDKRICEWKWTDDGH